jgi:endonuclease III
VVTLEDCEHAAYELIEGEREPSLMLALWASALSPQKSLEWNAAQLRPLRKHAERGLPFDTAEQLKEHIKRGAPNTMLYTQHCRAILRLDAMRAELRGLERMPETGREWIAWRKRVAKLPGLSWKTASFAALLMWPFECPFVPVDSHVCNRLGHDSEYESGKLSRKSKPSYRAYRAIEREVRREWAQAGYPTLSVAVWHWFKWEEHRQATGASRVRGGAETHRGLSARVYGVAA